jgi:hypothetical protein
MIPVSKKNSIITSKKIKKYRNSLLYLFFNGNLNLRYNKQMKKNYVLISFIIVVLGLNKQVISTEIKTTVPRAVLTMDRDTFYDQTFDYAHFSGRITDRDETGSIVKVSSETKNIRFFHAGDFIEFKIQTQSRNEFCQGYVRSIEENYFVMFVKDIATCVSQNEYFRRGTVLVMQSDKLAQRVKEASIYRASLMFKKKDYMQQLNAINQSVWTFEERRVQVAAEYDRKIIEVEKEKMKAVGELLSKKENEMRLQKELIARLDGIEREFVFYRVEKEELFLDRWHLDHDLGVPVYEKPDEVRIKLEHNQN